MTTNNYICPTKFCCNMSFSSQNNPKDLDSAYLDFCDCFGRKKTPSYNQRNTVFEDIDTNALYVILITGSICTCFIYKSLFAR